MSPDPAAQGKYEVMLAARDPGSARLAVAVGALSSCVERASEALDRGDPVEVAYRLSRGLAAIAALQAVDGPGGAR